MKEIHLDNLPVAVNESVLVNGEWLGRSFSEFGLGSIVSPGMLGGDAFTEVCFTTHSGNVYRIVQELDAFERPTDWVLTNSRAGHQGNYVFPDREHLASLKLTVGKGFLFGHGGATSMIRGILAINAKRSYAPGYLEKSCKFAISVETGAIARARA